MRNPRPLRPPQKEPLRSTGLDNFTVYTPKPLRHRHAPSLLELSIIGAISAVAMWFGIRHLFVLIAVAGAWLEHAR